MVKRNRVVITGMGVLAPNGIGLDAFWQSLLAGRSGIGVITLSSAASKLKSQIAGEVKILIRTNSSNLNLDRGAWHATHSLPTRQR